MRRYLAPLLMSRSHDLCNDVSPSSKKFKNLKKPSNTTKSTPSNTTERPHLNATNPLRKSISNTGTPRMPVISILPRLQVGKAGAVSRGLHLYPWASGKKREGKALAT